MKEENNQLTKIYLVSAYEEFDKFECGQDGNINKPIQIDKLRDIIIE